ncbi:hypothetical protein BGZ73_009206 [Actinomortierella ambigua]|nr:hypothetical protein BGZ73_009206 [Actinomortierella ambigua]
MCSMLCCILCRLFGFSDGCPAGASDADVAVAGVLNGDAFDIDTFDGETLDAFGEDLLGGTASVESVTFEAACGSLRRGATVAESATGALGLP